MNDAQFKRWCALEAEKEDHLHQVILIEEEIKRIMFMTRQMFLESQPVHTDDVPAFTEKVEEVFSKMNQAEKKVNRNTDPSPYVW
jgi:gamma-glutamylcysteine synthetase